VVRLEVTELCWSAVLEKVMREEFEKWVTSPPFEMPIERLSDDSAWPGCYKHIAVDLAWRAWQETAKAPQALTLLEAAKDALSADDVVYLRIREFLDQE